MNGALHYRCEEVSFGSLIMDIQTLPNGNREYTFHGALHVAGSFDRIVDLAFSLTDGAKTTFFKASKFGIEVEEQETKKFKIKTGVLDFEAKQIDDTTSPTLVVVVWVRRE